MISNWDKRYYSLAKFISNWSKDPRTKIGAVIVNNKNSIVSTGFNGFPRGIADLEHILASPEKYIKMVHGELNAVLNAAMNGAKTDGCTLYVSTYHPCSACACLLIQAGIKRIVCPVPNFDNEKWANSFAVAKDLFEEAGIEMEYLNE